MLEAKNKKRYLSRQHLASRLLCRDKLRVLSAWHALVLRTKCSLNKAHKRRLLLQGKLAAALVPLLDCDSTQKRFARDEDALFLDNAARAPGWCERYANGSLFRLTSRACAAPS